MNKTAKKQNTEKSESKSKLHAVSNGMEAKVYNQQGKETGSTTLSERVFGLPWNSDLVHQVVASMRANARTPVAHTKDRSDVSGGGKKPWRQKGTGRARHGSTRSPIWVGGGVAHGPRNEKNYARKINKKMRAKAFCTVLSEKLRAGEIIFMDKLEIPDARAKKAKDVLVSLSGVSGFGGLASKKNNALYLALAQKDDSVARSFKNFGNVALCTTGEANLLDVLGHKYFAIVQPKESLETIEKRIAKAV